MDELKVVFQFRVALLYRVIVFIASKVVTVLIRGWGIVNRGLKGGTIQLYIHVNAYWALPRTIGHPLTYLLT